MSTFFSVVVPLYNKRAFIEDAVRSVLSQHDPSFEIVVIDDGSVDGSAEVVERIHDPHIRLVRQQNSGVSVARNTGIGAATGKFICFLDADDWYLPGYLSTLRRLITTFPHAIAYGTAFHEVQGSAPTDLAFAEPQCPDDFKILEDFYSSWIFGEQFFTSSICVHKEALLRLDQVFAVDESLGEDQDVWFRIAESGAIAYTPSRLVAYRRNVADSLTAGRPELDLLPAFRRLESRLGESNFPKHLRSSARRLLARHCVTIARNNFFLGRRLTALRWLLCGYRPARSRYWWTTMTGVLICPTRLALGYEKWRRERVRYVAST
jgi:glycosyltransferase involved in cell wall biosynthesis